MTQLLEHLNESERELMFNALPLVTILVAEVDHAMTAAETGEASKIVHIRGYEYPAELGEFYKQLDKEFNERVHRLLRELPADPAQRQVAVEESLKGMNAVLAKIDPFLAHKFHHSMKSFARHVAEADGGIFGFFRINKNERHLLELPMIHPVVH